LVSDTQIAETDKIRPRSQLDLIRRNQEGQLSENFEFVLPYGDNVQALHDIQAAYILLFFYDPDCHHCDQAREQLMSSATLTSLQRAQRLKVVAIYPYADR